MLDALFVPQSVAVIGASRSPGKVGYEVISNLKQAAFSGAIVPVNPHAREILGLTCYRTLSEYAGSIDLCVIALPPLHVVDAVKDVLAKGAGAIAVLTAGLGEISGQGSVRQSEVVHLCREAGVRLLGPNCLGVINTDHGLNASFARHMPKPGGISILSQSGALCGCILEWARAWDLGLAKVVSIGNKADLDEIDILEALTEDDDTHIVVGYLESIASGERFVEAARELTARKPFVLLRAGITRSGIWAASAHTGNLAGAEVAYNAAFRHAGVVRADTLDALFDYTAALSTQSLPTGRRIAVVTNAGGPAVITADAIDRLDMKLAHLGDTTQKKLKQVLPEGVSTYNPIDILGDANPERYLRAVQAVQQDEGVDAIIVIMTPYAMTQPADTMHALAVQVDHGKPLLPVLLDATEMRGQRERRQETPLPDYPSPERAVAALRVMYDYHHWRHRPGRIVARFPVNRRRVERIITRHTKRGHMRIGEVAAKEILKAYDFAVPEGHPANSPEEAVEIAERIGFPVAMKIITVDVVHKSNVGGIKLGVSDSEQVRDMYDLLTLRVARRVPEARLRGVYVEKMCVEGLHVVMGVTSDPRFGPMLMFGVGGTFVDRLHELSYYLAPITEDEAMNMLAETRSYALLTEAKGQADFEISTIVGGLQRLSQLATDFPQIKELSIDPYVIGRTYRESMVVDVRITLGHEGKVT